LHEISVTHSEKVINNDSQDLEGGFKE